MICEWCGIEIKKHTEKQLEAAQYFLRILGKQHAYDAEPWKSAKKKLSKTEI